jgi:hypothetical protein
VKTTIELPDDLFRKLEKQAAQKGVDVAQFVTLAVTQAVNTSLNPAHQLGPKRVDFPLIESKGQVIALTSETIAQAETKEEAERYGRLMRR